jgi:hypothetical protein
MSTDVASGSVDRRRRTDPTWAGLIKLVRWLSLSGVGFGLLGFGVAWSIESHFGLARSSLVSSLLDLLELAEIGLMYGARLTMEVSYTWARYEVLLWNAALYVSAIAGGIVVAVTVRLFMHLARGRNFPRQTIMHRLRNWMGAKLECSAEQDRAGFKRHLANLGARLLDYADADREFLRKAAASFVGLLPRIAMQMIAPPLAVLWGFPLLTLFIVLILWAGSCAGDRYLQEHFLAVGECRPLEPLNVRLSTRATEKNRTACVELCRECNSVGRGEIVIATSSALVLYNPDTGAASLQRASDVSLRAISSLAPDAASSCGCDEKKTIEAVPREPDAGVFAVYAADTLRDAGTQDPL